MKINGKKLIAAAGLMAAGGLLAILETTRELTTSKHAEDNRKAVRILLDGYENGTLQVRPEGLGKVRVSAMYWGKAPDYAK